MTRLALLRLAGMAQSLVGQSRARIITASRSAILLLVCAAVSGCTARIVNPADATPVYRLDDGSVCRAPAGFAGIAGNPGTQQVRALFLASAEPGQVIAGLSRLPTYEQIEAAFYLSCGEYARGELSGAVFSQQRRLYQALRLEHLGRGIAQWRQDPDGLQTAGKLCHFIFSADRPDPRNVTRLVPPQTSVDDCALHVFNNGGTHVLLGCSQGQWRTDWAAKPLLVGPNGWAVRTRAPVGTQYVPEPNCGW